MHVLNTLEIAAVAGAGLADLSDEKLNKRYNKLAYKACDAYYSGNMNKYNKLMNKLERIQNEINGRNA